MGDNNMSLVEDKDLNQRQTKEKHDMDCFADTIQCNVCNFTKDSKYGLSKHKRTHVKNEGFLCPTCPKVFSRHSSLNEHIKVHGRELPGRKFTSEEKIEAIELSKVLVIFLNGWTLPIGEGASRRVCAFSLCSRLVLLILTL